MANLLNSIIYYLKDAIVKDGSGNVNISGNETVGGSETVNGNVLVDGYLTMRTNGQAISFKDASDPAQIHSMIYITPSNYFGLGYGMYNSNKGETRLYGDTIRMYSHNPIVTNQGMEIGGSLTVDGHSSPIGTKVTGTRESTAGTATTSYTTAAHIDLTAGTWLITGFNAFNGGTAGKRSILITGTSTATWDAAEGSASGYAAASMQVALSTSLIVTSTGNETYYLRIKSASQVDSPGGNLTAVRIA